MSEWNFKTNLEYEAERYSMMPMLCAAYTLQNETAVTESERWRHLLQSDTMGCSAGITDPYYWRVAGYGSNANCE